MYIIDGVAIKDEFFILTPFWVSATFKRASNQLDFECRGVTGFIRSSPAYNYEPCKKMAKAYFDGTMPTESQAYFSKVIKNDCKKLIDVINGVTDPGELKLLKPNERSFIDVLLAYIHSPLQTRHGREPLQDEETEENFKKIMEKIPLSWYVEKVVQGDSVTLPRRKLVSTFLCCIIQYSSRRQIFSSI